MRNVWMAEGPAWRRGAAALACGLAAWLTGCAHFTRSAAESAQPQTVVRAEDAAQVQAAAARLFATAGYSMVSRDAQTMVLDREVEAKGQTLFIEGEARSALKQRIRLRVVPEEAGIFRVTASAVVITNRAGVPMQDAPVSGRSGEELQRLLKRLPGVIR